MAKGGNLVRVVRDWCDQTFERLAPQITRSRPVFGAVEQAPSIRARRPWFQVATAGGRTAAGGHGSG